MDLALPVVDGIVDGDPDIEQAEAGDDAAGDSVEGERSEMRDEGKELVFVPEVQPGQDNDDESQVKTNDDANEEVEALKPAWRLPGRLCAFRRIHGEPRGWCNWQLRGKQIRLLRHAME